MAQFVGPAWYNSLAPNARAVDYHSDKLRGTALHQALTGIARLTATAAASYQSAEQGIAASFGRGHA
jgi:hypothetical protein